MAYLETLYCSKCGKDYQGCRTRGSFLDTCGECSAKESEAKRKEYFDALDKLSTEERLRKVEEWIYYYQPPSSTPDIY